MSMKKLPQYLPKTLEEGTLSQWNKHKIFEKSLAMRKDAPSFSFYDGPPFANGLPHFGHSLVTAIKDAMGRYKTMRGYYVERRNGWDCHGLPVEYEIEKKFGISGKKQILELGLDKFNAACRESVFTYKHEWEAFFERIGRWTDTEHAYATIEPKFIESVWWALAEVHKRDLLYRGHKTMPYCPRCETPLSNFELNEGYREGVEDPSLYVKFKLKDDDAYLLAWTTTPWSLPGNAALAVNPKASYVRIQLKDDDGQNEELILAQSRLGVLDAQYEIIEKIPAQQLVGKHYEPLFKIKDLKSDKNIYKVWDADFVSIEDGTGVLHVAPAFGEDDMALGEEHNLPVLRTIDSSGHVTDQVEGGHFRGMFFKEADSHIIEYLTEQNLVYSAETLTHIYPFCYRCDSPLLYYAVTTWFIKVSSMREELLEKAQSINWTPAHVKNGRFGKWLEGARDWAISRNRYWGSPLPIWVNEDDQDDYIVISSVDELKKLAEGNPDLTDLHRPGIDDVIIKKDGKIYRRVEEVLDCWFESGSMPYGSFHYPFENKEKFEASFPADYVGEGLDQTRLWFYVLHVLSTIIFDRPAYKHVIVNGMILASDGQKLSKRLKNYPPIEDVFANEGADALRYYLLSSPATVGDYMRFSRDGLRDVSRNIFMTLYNSASFLSLYAEVDQWEPVNLGRPTQLKNPLDQWMLARLDQTIELVTEGADAYNIARAIRPLADLVDDLSNWYVRRSRRRFWKSENDADKEEAYKTLYYTLVTMTQLFAPWAPFISDYIYMQLTQGVPDTAKSVHLTDWPKAAKEDTNIIEQMSRLRELVAEGLAQRAGSQIKVRQPLSSVTLNEKDHFSPELEGIIKDELNIKEIIYSKKTSNDITVDLKLNEALLSEGLVRDLVRHIQTTRKKIGLEVEDRIDLKITTKDKKLESAITQFTDLIKAEVLATSLKVLSATAEDPISIDKHNFGLTITKAP